MNQLESRRETHLHHYLTLANIRQSYNAAQVFCRPLICFLLAILASGQTASNVKHSASDSSDQRKCTASKDQPICPFQMNILQPALDDLRRRTLGTRWPEQETVTDDSQCVRSVTMKAPASYCTNDYDWRECEAKLNSYPQFVTNIDGLDVHFIHVRSAS